MVTVAFIAPILPGKTDAWLSFAKELNGPQRAKALESRQRAGIHREQTFLQRSPRGDAVVVVMEVDRPEALQVAFTGKGAFDDWFRAQVREIHGMDLHEFAKAPPIHPVFDLKP